MESDPKHVGIRVAIEQASKVDSPSQNLQIWTGVGDVNARLSCCGGSLLIGDATEQHWSKEQANVAFSNGEAELNSSVRE